MLTHSLFVWRLVLHGGVYVPPSVALASVWVGLWSPTLCFSWMISPFPHFPTSGARRWPSDLPAMPPWWLPRPPLERPMFGNDEAGRGGQVLRSRVFIVALPPSNFSGTSRRRIRLAVARCATPSTPWLPLPLPCLTAFPSRFGRQACVSFLLLESAFISCLPPLTDLCWRVHL